MNELFQYIVVYFKGLFLLNRNFHHEEADQGRATMFFNIIQNYVY